jgi:mRNA-degrading endonuclease RelE of RelBE toxin-antitoxin system
MQQQQQEQQQQQYQYVYEDEDDEDDEPVPPPPVKKARRQQQQQLQSTRIQKRLEELRVQLLDLKYRRLNRAVQFGLPQVNRMRDLEYRVIRQVQEELAVARARQAARTRR